MISSVQDAKLIILDGKGNVNYLENAYGFSANDVLELRQGSTGVSNVYKRFMDELEESLNESNIEMAKDVVARAKSEFGDSSMVYQELSQYLKLNV